MTAREKAFSLVEVLIVVVLLAILAAVATPKFFNATKQAKTGLLADDLRVIRSQIQVFQSQHNHVPPGYPDCDRSQAPTEQAFVEQMTMATTADGQVAPAGTPGYDFGPYFREVPANPFNEKSSIQIIPDDQEVPDIGDDSHGWIYKPDELIFKADSSGTDENGVRYIDY